VAKEAALTAEEIKKLAEREAVELRRRYALGIRGLGDIFRFVEQTLKYLLVRYPLGKESLQGFSAVYRGERLIFSNSSLILSREIFTVAHEIGHHVFDIQLTTPTLIRDQETGEFTPNNALEYRADCFAAELLMPREGIEEVASELKFKDNGISYSDIVRLQVEFGVSYRAMVRRLTELGWINKDKAQYFYHYFENTGYNLQGLFRRVHGGSLTLLVPSNQIWVPSRYFRCLEQNYENGYVSYPVLKEILRVMGVTPDELGFEEKEPVLPEEIDFDELLKDLDED
jgi:Zn-dependent peptidase ImmA (M78 family)